jgi:hypothetical protein
MPSLDGRVGGLLNSPECGGTSSKLQTEGSNKLIVKEISIFQGRPSGPNVLIEVHESIQGKHGTIT